MYYPTAVVDKIQYRKKYCNKSPKQPLPNTNHPTKTQMQNNETEKPLFSPEYKGKTRDGTSMIHKAKQQQSKWEASAAGTKMQAFPSDETYGRVTLASSRKRRQEDEDGVDGEEMEGGGSGGERRLGREGGGRGWTRLLLFPSWETLNLRK